MNNNVECAMYLKEHKEYARCMNELYKKWKSYGSVKGSIILCEPSQEERRAVCSIIGKFLDEKDIKFTFKEFERGLKSTRFGQVDMKEVFEAYYGEKLMTNQERELSEQQKKMQFFDSVIHKVIENCGGDLTAVSWIRDAIQTKKYGYQLIIKEYNKDAVCAKELVCNAAMAIVRLADMSDNAREYPLAVFAAMISGNPHYFDRGTVPGTLLGHAICYREKCELKNSAHEWRNLLLGVGLVPDNISSIVHMYGLRLGTNEGWHPAYEAFLQRKEPCVITMENLKNITNVEAPTGRVYVVENEMVFSYLLENAINKDITLLCTSGQPRIVALELLKFMCDRGIDIFYSGDIDPDGICIADRLWKKYGTHIHIWRMSPEDYDKSISNEKITAVGKNKLSGIEQPQLRKTAQCVAKRQMAGYQENILDELLGDIGQL